MLLRLLALLAFIALPAHADEEIVLGLSQDEIDITATFVGSEILVFGAIKRDSPAPDGQLGVIVTVAGPDTPVTVRRKERRFGIWVNVDDVEIAAAPSFYAVASSADLSRVLRPSEDLIQQITIPQVVREVGANVLDSQSFARALMRIRTGNEQYQRLEGAVSLSRDTLFETRIKLPANLTEGFYVARIFLTRDGNVVDEYVTTIPVKKVGLERWLYNLAHENAFLYGLMSLAIAIAAGWGASAVFTLFRR
ncbi:MAG: TIGR02186 family protein [Yoonia sp.]|nr:TIGR02186 family protein [Yoonia sp.]MDG1768677.1 TIGR02186 family protein [Yoonia sp.]